MMNFIAFLGPFLSNALANPIVGGELSDEHPEAVLISISGYTCTGTLVDPSWVLTAAHCVVGASTNWAKVYVGADPRHNDIDAQSGITAMYAHPDYRSNMSNGADAGLIQLTDPIYEVEPAMLTRTPVDDTWKGRDVRYVGYGVTTEDSDDSGTKRAVTVPFYQFDQHWMYTWDKGHNMCWGDSGGPAYVEMENGVVVAGVISWVGTWYDDQYPCSTGWGSSTRIDTVLDWIEEYLEPSYVEDVGLEPVDTGTPADTGQAPNDSGAADTGQADETTQGKDKGGCGCHAGSGVGFLGAGLGLLGLVRRRRRNG